MSNSKKVVSGVKYNFEKQNSFWFPVEMIIDPMNWWCGQTAEGLNREQDYTISYFELETSAKVWISYSLIFRNDYMINLVILSKVQNWERFPVIDLWSQWRCWDLCLASGTRKIPLITNLFRGLNIFLRKKQFLRDHLILIETIEIFFLPSYFIWSSSFVS